MENSSSGSASRDLVVSLVKDGQFQKALSLILNPDAKVDYAVATEAVIRYLRSNVSLNDQKIRVELKNFNKLIEFIYPKAGNSGRLLHVFSNFFQPYIPWREISLDKLNETEFSNFVEIQGLEQLMKHKEEQSGCILALSHMAAGRICTLALCRLNFKITSLEFANRLGRYQIDGIKNLTVIEIGNGAKFLLPQVYQAKKALESGQIFQLAADGYQGDSGITINFLGKLRTFKTGFAELSILTKKPIYPIFCKINLKGRVIVKVGAPLSTPPNDLPKEDKVRQIVNEYANLLSNEWLESPSNISSGHVKKFLELPNAP